jgi:hypothetical protein
MWMIFDTTLQKQGNAGNGERGAMSTLGMGGS